VNTEERVRGAAEATASSVRQIRPLALPDGAASAGSSEQRGRTMARPSGTFTRIKETWVIPLGAAAAVAALTLSLITLRHAEPPRPAPANGAAADAGIPRYYVIASAEKASHDGRQATDVIVGDVHTGKTLATVVLSPDGLGLGLVNSIGVSAAADDRTFVVSRRDSWGDMDYFLVRIAPGAREVATVRRLPFVLVNPGAELGFAVSPDGRKMAVLTARGNGTTLRIYSVTSGTILRAWTAARWQYHGDGAWATGVSWTADNRAVAFSTVLTAAPYAPAHSALTERLIGVAEPSGDLAAASRAVFKAPGNCMSLLLTPDGGTVVCATQANFFQFDAPPPGCGGKHGPMFVTYSAAAGKRLRVLYQYPGPCVRALDTVLWSDNAARHVIGEVQTDFGGNPPVSTDRYGVAAAGTFVKFPVAKHGQWYGGPAF
jgi:hypothetical protein